MNHDYPSLRTPPPPRVLSADDKDRHAAFFAGSMMSQMFAVLAGLAAAKASLLWAAFPAACSIFAFVAGLVALFAGRHR